MTDWERIVFMLWVERTHPDILNDLLSGYNRYKQGLPTEADK